MVSLKTPIALLGIAVALVVVFFTLNRFGLPTLEKIGESTSNFFGDAGKGISDFFDSIDKNRNDALVDSIRGDADPDFLNSTPIDVERELSDLDPKSETFEEDRIALLEDLGFQNAEFEFNDEGKITKITQKDNTIKNNGFEFPSFDLFPQAFGEEQTTPEIIPISEERPISLTEFATKRPQPKQGSTTIQGTVKSNLDTDNVFQVFSADSSRPVRGVIRKTPKDPRKLRTNSKKQPLETASQRANRVFIESGKFADEDRGFGVTSAKEKTRDFDFGSNTGSGLKIATKGLSARQRLEARKKLAEQEALKIFNSGAISNF